MGNLKITQVKSAIGRTSRQKRTLEALGLRKLHHTVVKEDGPVLQGMISQVRHLVNVEEAQIMNLNSLKPAKGSLKREKRIGRGEGSGSGGTASRGHKGAQSRSGYSKKRGFEGGQMPLQRRVPKFGFKPLNKVEFIPVNLDLVQQLVDKTGVSEISQETFITNGLASKNDRIKVLGRGELNAVVSISAHAFSKSAQAAIEAKGGTCTNL